MIRFILSVIFLSASLAHAELKFETLSVDGGTAAIGDTEFVAKFPFKNTGDSKITILATNSSCGCTTPTLEKKVYAPGESGEIVASFDFGVRSGFQEKKITVVTDNEAQKRVVLKLEVIIPKVIEVKPRVALWSFTKEPELQSKTIEVILGEGIDGSLRLWKFDAEKFDVTLEYSDKEGVDAIVTVMPKNKERARTTIEVELVDESGKVIATEKVFGIIR